MSCHSCDKGDEPAMLDDNGVLCTVSGRPGQLCHAADDMWWPCPEMPEAPNHDRFEAWLKTRLGQVAASRSVENDLRAAFLAGALWRRGAHPQSLIPSP